MVRAVLKTEEVFRGTGAVHARFLPAVHQELRAAAESHGGVVMGEGHAAGGACGPGVLDERDHLFHEKFGKFFALEDVFRLFRLRQRSPSTLLKNSSRVTFAPYMLELWVWMALNTTREGSNPSA